jgi:SAM-dependent methyltransferase
MIKDYIRVKSEIIPKSDIHFVEDLWSDKLKDHDPVNSDFCVENREEFWHLYKWIKKLLETDDWIVDGGCGRGEWVISLADKGYNIRGVDISRSLIDNLQINYPKYDFQRGDIRNLEFKDRSIAMYFSWGAFEHFEIGLSPCLDEAYRVLRFGGYLIFSVPFANSRLQKNHEKGLKQKYVGKEDQQRAEGTAEDRFYQWRFTIGEVAREARLAGFEIISVDPIHKDEGLRRMLSHDFRLKLTPASILETMWLKVLRLVVPASYVSHMLLVVSVKN